MNQEELGFIYDLVEVLDKGWNVDDVYIMENEDGKKQLTIELLSTKDEDICWDLEYENSGFLKKVAELTKVKRIKKL